MKSYILRLLWGTLATKLYFWISRHFIVQNSRESQLVVSNSVVFKHTERFACEPDSVRIYMHSCTSLQKKGIKFL